MDKPDDVAGELENVVVFGRRWTIRLGRSRAGPGPLRDSLLRQAAPVGSSMRAKSPGSRVAAQRAAQHPHQRGAS